MCRVKQFVYSCGHPATESFRYRLCQSPGTTTCVAVDDQHNLNSPCARCIRAKAGRTAQDLQEFSEQTATGWEKTNRRVFTNGDSALDFEWHVPSRCFVDQGFRSLDPFGDDKKKQLRLAPSGITETREEERELAPDELEEEPMAGHSGDMMEVDDPGRAEEWQSVPNRLHSHPPSIMEQQASAEEQLPRISIKPHYNELSTEEQQGPSTMEQKLPVSIKLHCNPPPAEKKRPRLSIKLICRRRSIEEQRRPSTEEKPRRISIKLNCNWVGKIAPCCARQKKQGPLYMTRPEDAAERREGRIAGDTCTSGF